MLHRCPNCDFTDVRLSKRRTWERVLRLRALRCVACYHRFLCRDDSAGPWSVGTILLWMSRLGLVLAGVYLRLPPG